MTKKLETQLLVTSLKKAAKKTEQEFWGDLAERLEKPLKNKIEVNLSKISKLAAKNEGKIIVIPGKVLSSGELTEKATIVAAEASEKAKQKISAKGKFISMKEYAQKAEKEKPSEAIIVA